MRFPTSDVQLYLIEVDTHHSARGPSRPSEFEGHITAAAPNIEACRTGRYSNFSQQRTGGRTHHLGQEAEPFAAFHSASDYVPLGGRDSPPACTDPANFAPSSNK